jgi:hypothetical protein
MRYSLCRAGDGSVLFCSSQHIVEAQLKVAYQYYLEVGYAGHVSSPAKFK